MSVSPTLVNGLERLRSAVNKPVIIISGYRCSRHNARVGGARRSEHLYGRAADLRLGLATVAQAQAAGFTGIGFKGSSAVHVDVRAGPLTKFAD